MQSLYSSTSIIISLTLSSSSLSPSPAIPEKFERTMNKICTWNWHRWRQQRGHEPAAFFLILSSITTISTNERYLCSTRQVLNDTRIFISNSIWSGRDMYYFYPPWLVLYFFLECILIKQKKFKINTLKYYWEVCCSSVLWRPWKCFCHHPRS